MTLELARSSLVVGLGGNVGGDDAIRGRFVAARTALAELGPVRSAALYRTAPLTATGLAIPADPPQDWHLNTAVHVRVEDATAGELLATILELERLLGRDRRGEARWGPRTIDLDLLVWGPRVVETPELELPHPRLRERRFALQPLVDLVSADTLLPGTASTLGELVRRVVDQPLEELAASW
jgi:2-amino-4-hydroxy-6-hydroxymethyldihydropteridine diphosphokinase